MDHRSPTDECGCVWLGIGPKIQTLDSINSEHLTVLKDCFPKITWLYLLSVTYVKAPIMTFVMSPIEKGWTSDETDRDWPIGQIVYQKWMSPEKEVNTQSCRLTNICSASPPSFSRAVSIRSRRFCQPSTCSFRSFCRPFSKVSN